jgi:hypothetical protein
MKTINYLMASALTLFAVAACQVEPASQDPDNEYLVYTAPSKDVDLSQYMTFDIADSVLVIGQTAKPYYSQSNNALALIQAFRTNMENRGYIYTPSNPIAQFGIRVPFIERTER